MSALPPLASIRVFEAVARHLSFTKAAVELGMTQAAVSYQIKVLEERLGSPLFLRRPRQIVLTELGTALAPQLRQAFDLMREAFAETRGKVDNLLSISSVPSFANNWLAKTLGLFQVIHTDIAVRLETSSEKVDLVHGEFDVGIRTIPQPEGEGIVSHLLLRADFSPLLSPGLAQQVREPADLLQFPLLDPHDEWWGMWFAAAGIDGFSAAGRPAISMGHQSLLGAAAVAGRGVTMLTPALFRDELAAGTLVQPFPLRAVDGRGYYLVYGENRRNAPKIRMFRDWILEATAFMREAH